MKKYIVLVLIVLLTGALFVGVTAAPAGKSNVGHLDFYEKSGEPDWEIVDGAWGKMEYKLSGPEFDFVFNGKGLEPGLEYALIVYKGTAWPGEGICLGSALANGGGNVHISDSVEIDRDLDQVKIWLVLADDTDGDGLMTAWDPASYLFENDLIDFDDTDV